jgi:hypothetical protein
MSVLRPISSRASVSNGSASSKSPHAAVFVIFCRMRLFVRQPFVRRNRSSTDHGHITNQLASVELLS